MGSVFEMGGRVNKNEMESEILTGKNPLPLNDINA